MIFLLFFLTNLAGQPLAIGFDKAVTYPDMASCASKQAAVVQEKNVKLAAVDQKIAFARCITKEELDAVTVHFGQEIVD
jgi:hypothetical protein